MRKILLFCMLACCFYSVFAQSDNILDKRKIKEINAVVDSIRDHHPYLKDQKTLVYVQYTYRDSRIQNEGISLYFATLDEGAQSIKEYLVFNDEKNLWQIYALKNTPKYVKKSMSKYIQDLGLNFKQALINYTCLESYREDIEIRESEYSSHSDQLNYLIIYDSDNRACYKGSYEILSFPQQIDGILSIYPFQLLLHINTKKIKRKLNNLSPNR